MFVKWEFYIEFFRYFDFDFILVFGLIMEYDVLSVVLYVCMFF